MYEDLHSINQMIISKRYKIKLYNRYEMFYLNPGCGLCDLIFILPNLADLGYLLDKGVF